MQGEIIHLSDALNLMEVVADNNKPIPFQIKWVTHSKTTGTGGKVLEFDQAIKVMGVKNGKMINAVRKTAIALGKNPNHYKNQTRNISYLNSNQIRKIHIRLILEFNHKKVIW
jgi:hypothetical protein